MNTPLTILDWLFRVGWQSAVLVLLVLLAQRLFRRRLSAGWRHALWLVVVARLLLPVTFTSTFSLLNLVSPPLPQANRATTVPAPPPSNPTASERDATPAFDLAPTSGLAGPESDTAIREQSFSRDKVGSKTPLPAALAGPIGPAARPFDWLGFAFRLWLFGVFGFSVLTVWLVVRARRRLAGTTPVDDEPVPAILDSCCRAMGLRSRPVLAATPGLATPALCGLWRPRILLPAGFADRFSPEELRFVFLHELAHLKRGDLVLNWLMTALQIVHWWNPLIWLAFARMRADRELACDELALAVTGEGQRHAYGETILHLLESVRRPVAIPGLVGILEDKHRLKERLERIAGFRKPSRWSALAVVLLGALAVVGLTDPLQPGSEESVLEPGGAETAPEGIREPDAEEVPTLPSTDQGRPVTPTNTVSVAEDGEFRFQARVVDAEGAGVITNAVLFLGNHLFYQLGPLVWKTSDAQREDNGGFSISRQSAPSIPVSFGVVAPGYVPQVTPMMPEEGIHDWIFRLKRGNPTSGVVVDAAGNPVSGAQVAELGHYRRRQDSPRGGVRLDRDGLLAGSYAEFLTVTDVAGHFSLPLLTPNLRFVAAHPSYGYGEVSGEDLADSGRLTLHPWGRVAGTLRFEGWVGANERVQIRPADPSQPLALTPGFSYVVFTTHSDADGRFVIERVPPVEVQLVLESSFPLPLKVKAGDTTEVTFPFAGGACPVMGRPVLRVAGTTAPSFDWTMVDAKLMPRGERGYVRAWIRDDGRFLFPFVQPGDYDLVAEVYAGLDGTNGFGTSAPVPFSLSTNLPPDREPLDLGEIVVVPEEVGGAAARSAADKKPWPPYDDQTSAPSTGPEASSSQEALRSPPKDNRLWFTVKFEGRPVPDADVRFASADVSTFEAHLSAPGFTDKQGRSFIYPDVRADLLVVTSGNHAAEVRLADLTNGCEIALEAEASLSGSLWIGGRPWPNQHLRIVRRYESAPIIWGPTEAVQVTTDAEGRFEFPGLAAGAAEVLLATPPFATRNPPPRFGGVLHGYGPVSQRLASIDLAGGQSNRLDLRLPGRPVKARAVWQDELQPPDWMAMEVLLVDRSTTPWVMARGLPAPDGSLLVPYAEPRSYQLVLELYRDPSTPEWIGGTALPVTITTNLAEGATPLDLGAIVLKPRLPKAAQGEVSTRQSTPAGEAPVVKPLGGIYGLLTLGGQAWTNQLLGLCHASESVQKPSFEWSHQTRTDEQGRYHFPNAGQGLWEIWLRTPRPREEPEVIPGRVVPPPLDYPFGRRLARVEIFDHETVERDIHKQGRVIVGAAVVANPVRPVDLRASTLVMRFSDSKGIAGLTGAFVRKDGSFTIPCLQPGEYRLYLSVEGALAAGPTAHTRVVGAAEPRLVSVTTNLSEGTAPIDLGEIPVTLRKPLFLGDRAPDFEAMTFEGNTLRLADWLGQPVLLILGCPNMYNRTRGELGRFDEWYLQRGDSERPSVILLGVGSADDLDWLRAGGYPWPTIDANAQRKFFEDEYEATWAPDFILLDAQGRVVARDYRFDEIRPAIEGLMSEFSATPRHPGTRALIGPSGWRGLKGSG